MFQATSQKWIRFLLIATALTGVATAADPATSTVAAGGYDLVSYHQSGQPQRGTGLHATVHDGQTYLFASKENKEAFEKDPGKYLPEFGGYCAYGVAVNKKFVGDPTVWELVKGKLYFNLNTDIQATWQKDISGFIKTANKNWRKIKSKAPSDL